MESVLALHHAAPGSNLGIPKNFSLEVIDGTALNSGQGLDHVNQTHLVLASGKLVLQKRLVIRVGCQQHLSKEIALHCFVVQTAP